jgi:hypothetical protein
LFRRVFGFKSVLLFQEWDIFPTFASRFGGGGKAGESLKEGDKEGFRIILK